MKEEKNYLQERTTPIPPLTMLEEVARCLLCYDAPCTKACPANSDPARFIRSLRFRNFDGALEILNESNIPSGVCAKFCSHNKYCEDACNRSQIDKSIEIAKLQSYICDYKNQIEVESSECLDISIETLSTECLENKPTEPNLLARKRRCSL